MNEFLRQFIMKTIFKMIDNVPEWQVREYALGWYSKGILTEADLEEIEERYKEPEEVTENFTESTENFTEIDTGEETGINEEATDTDVGTIEETSEETEVEE